MTSGRQLLYRIQSFRHVVDMFQSRTLFFAAPNSWDDPYENQIIHKGSNRVFAQCWCKKSVSDAMWRIYSSDRTGIRIRTSRAKLRKLLLQAKKNLDIGYLISDVKYFPSSKVNKNLKLIADDLRINYTSRRAADALLYKRSAFDHEAEVRVLIHDKSPADDGSERTSYLVSIDPHDFVENIYFDPRVDPVFQEVCTYYLRHALGYKGKVGRSALYSVGDPIVVE